MRMWKDLQSRKLKSSYNKIGRFRFNVRGRFLDRNDSLAIASGFILCHCLLYDNLELCGLDKPVPLCFDLMESIGKEASADFPAFIERQKSLTALIRSNFQWSKMLHEVPKGPQKDFLVQVGAALRWKTGVLEFQAIHGYLNYMIKIPCGAEDLSDIYIDKWVSEDDDLTNYTISSHSGKANLVRFVIEQWFSDYTPRLVHGPFSNGSTADCGVDMCAKLSTRMPADLKIALSHFPIDEEGYYLLKEWPTCDRLGPSKMQVVPKTAISLRPICMEPANMNLWQGFFARDLVDYIHTHEIMRKHINLHKQELSRKQAVRASLDERDATVDLSSASDRIAFQHVEFLFGDTPVWPLLKALRSDRAEYRPGLVKHLNKFASMGSMLCFPIETIVFAAMCEAACRWTSNHGVCDRSYRVYGDDIIIDRRALPVLWELFSEFGYKPNKDKSYAFGPFREACGVFAYNGYDVTCPTYPRGRQIHIYGKVRPNEVSTITDLANEYFSSFGYGLYRYMLVAALLNTFGDLQRFSEKPSENSLLTFDATNYRAKERWNPRKKKWEVLTYTLKPKYAIKYAKKAERDRLDLWLFLATTTERESLLKAVKGTNSECLLPVCVPVGARVLDVSVRHFWR